MDHSKTIAKMNDILRHEWTGVAQYAQAGFVVSGLWREVYSKMFFTSAQESFGHARLVGDKIVSLGGVPTIERNPIKQSHDVVEMLEFALEFETKAVQLYSEVIALAEQQPGSRPLIVMLEDILQQEQDGVDHITKLLRDQRASASTGSTTAKVG